MVEVVEWKLPSGQIGNLKLQDKFCGHTLANNLSKLDHRYQEQLRDLLLHQTQARDQLREQVHHKVLTLHFQAQLGCFRALHQLNSPFDLHLLVKYLHYLYVFHAIRYNWAHWFFRIGKLVKATTNKCPDRLIIVLVCGIDHLDLSRSAPS